MLPPIELILGVNDYKPEPVKPTYTLDQKYDLFLKLREILLVNVDYNAKCVNYQNKRFWEQSRQTAKINGDPEIEPIVEYARHPYIKLVHGGLKMVRPDFATFCDLLDQGRI